MDTQSAGVRHPRQPLFRRSFRSETFVLVKPMTISREERMEPGTEIKGEDIPLYRLSRSTTVSGWASKATPGLTGRSTPGSSKAARSLSVKLRLSFKWTLSRQHKTSVRKPSSCSA